MKRSQKNAKFVNLVKKKLINKKLLPGVDSSVPKIDFAATKILFCCSKIVLCFASPK